MKLVIHEDSTYENFYPLSLIRPVFELRCGATSLSEKLRSSFSNLDVAYFTRDYLTETFQTKVGNAPVNDLQAIDDDLFIVNGRWLCMNTQITAEGPEEIGVKEDSIVYVRVQQETVRKYLGQNINEFLSTVLEVLPQKAVDEELVSYCWNIVHHNSRL